jgi:hypothetical protein
MESIMEALKGLLTDFDPASFVPELHTVVGWLELIVRIAVMAGPLMLLVLGLWYLLLPPKEANHIAGYRFFWGMGSVQSWRFTQLVAGIGCTALGLILTLVMVIIVAGYRGMDPMQMCYNAVTCLLWQIGTAAVTYLAIHVIVVVFFDFKGNPRNFAANILKKNPIKLKKST